VKNPPGGQSSGGFWWTHRHIGAALPLCA
jgi:hypothetical protein